MTAAIVEELLKEVTRVYEDKQQLPDDLISGLNSVLPNILGPALELVDRRSVRRFVSTSGRVVFQCKHVLAIRLSEAMNLSEETKVTDEHLKNMLCDVD